MKIGILQTGYVAEALAPAHGEYPAMFETLFGGRGFRFETWAVLDDVFPQSPVAADGWLVTGSKHGAYDDLPWIARLESFLRACYEADRPMIGICFGHQILAQALGGRVEKFAGGWSVGPVAYDHGGALRRSHAWHQDQVVAKPPAADIVGTTPFCAIAALLYPGKAYSVQPHPEILDPYMQGLIKVRGPGVVPDALLDTARDGVGTPLDTKIYADEFELFLRERRLA